MSDPAEIVRRKVLLSKQRELHQIRARECDIDEKLAQCEMDIITLKAQRKQNDEIMAKVEADLKSLAQGQGDLTT